MAWTVDRWKGVAGLAHGFGSRHDAPPAGVTTLRQVHGRVVHAATEVPEAGAAGDGVIVSRSGEGAAIRTADCVPVLLVAPAARVAAVVHAGWRGAAAGIVDRTLERLDREWNVAIPAVEAALGPSIGACCYEVGAEVYAAFRKSYGPGGDEGFERRAGSLFLDLRRFLDARLRRLGVSRVESTGPCTGCTPAELCSYRKEGPGTGRQHSWILWL